MTKGVYGEFPFYSVFMKRFAENSANAAVAALFTVGPFEQPVFGFEFF